MTDEKQYIDARQLYIDSLRLGQQVLESGFRPDWIVGVWRGGTPVGIVVQELLDFYGVHTDHISIRTSSYKGMQRREAGAVRVHGLGYLIRQMNTEDSLLIVDDVFDTGLSVKAILESLKDRLRRNMPHDTRVATAYYKPSKNRTDLEPHYSVHQTSEWLVFPHELDGLSLSEIMQNKPDAAGVIEALNRTLTPVKMRAEL